MVAVTVVFPCLTAVITPESLTFATFVSADAHVTFVYFADALGGIIVVLIVTASPASNETDFLLRVRDVTLTPVALTVTVAVATRAVLLS